MFVENLKIIKWWIILFIIFKFSGHLQFEIFSIPRIFLLNSWVPHEWAPQSFKSFSKKIYFMFMSSHYILLNLCALVIILTWTYDKIFIKKPKIKLSDSLLSINHRFHDVLLLQAWLGTIRTSPWVTLGPCIPKVRHWAHGFFLVYVQLNFNTQIWTFIWIGVLYYLGKDRGIEMLNLFNRYQRGIY